MLVKPFLAIIRGISNEFGTSRVTTGYKDFLLSIDQSYG